ncbi:MAG: hypothetical protein AAF484_14335 [Pseudomonadota bacterium]
MHFKFIIAGLAFLLTVGAGVHSAFFAAPPGVAPHANGLTHPVESRIPSGPMDATMDRAGWTL